MGANNYLLAALWLMLGLSSFSDVIYFKNGNVLIVENAWEEGGLINYQSFTGIQSVSKSLVRRIQVQKPAPADPSRWNYPKSFGPWVAPTDFDLTVPKVTPPPQFPSSQSSKAIVERCLRNVEANPSDENSRQKLRQALNAYASVQLLKGDRLGARKSLDQALGYDQNDLKTLMNLAFVTYRVGAYRASVDSLQQVIEFAPNIAYAHSLLGAAYYAQDQISEAIKHWEIALKLGPSDKLTQRLKKARLEARTHSELGVLRSSHFILRYDREVSDYNLGQEILYSLERNYRHLTLQLLSHPPETVAVILYPDQTYFDVTRAPRWSGALFDGKIRIPTRGLLKVSDQLNSVLIHELTHSFLSSLGQRQLPTWFNEGIAQMQEGKTTQYQKQYLAALYLRKQLIPLADLKDSFVGLSNQVVNLAYLQSLSSVEYLVSRYGRQALRQILEMLRQNHTFESALKTATRQNLVEFERAWLGTLKP